MIGLERLGLEARQRVAEIAPIKRCIPADFTGEKPPAQRAVGHKADSQFFQRRQNFRFRTSPPERIFVLQRRHRLHGMGTADGLHPGFGKAEVPYFTLPDQLFHRSGHILDRHFRIDSMLIEQIDGVGPESFKGSFGDFFDMLRSTVQHRCTLCSPGIEAGVETELGGDHHLIAHWKECLSYQLLVEERAIDFSRVEEGYATFHGFSEKRDHLLFIRRRTVRKTHSHTSQTESRYLQTVFA